MKKLIQASIFVLVMASFGFANPALAYYPNLSVYSSGGDNITVSVNGAQPNSSIALSYTPSGSSLATTVSNFGYTDYSGNYSTSISAYSYGMSTGSQIYVTVAGQQSNTVNYNYSGGGCTYNCGSPYGLSLSQNSLYLNQGQNSSVTVYYSGSSYYYNNFYIASNSNSSVATASVSGNQINVYAQSNGSTNINICATGGTACASLYVTVSGSGNCGYNNCNNNIWLSQTNLNLSSGQSGTVNISSNYYSGNYYVSSNSNSGVATASISGSTLNVYANSTGNTTIMVCQSSSGNTCASLYVTVSGGSCTYNCGNLQLSQTTVNFSLGQSTVVTAYNAGSLYISSNSNSSAVSASVSGSSINLYASNYGSSNIVVCGNSYSQCATIYVTVSGGSGSGISLSQNSVSLNYGQTSTISVYGSGSYYVASNNNPSVVTASLSGSTLSLYGLSSGTSTVNVCQQNYSGQCASVYVTVYGSGNVGGLSLSQNNLSLTQGQSATVSIYNPTYYSSSYYISSNSNSYVASANISGSQVNVYANNNGSTTITICQNTSYNSCVTLYVNVGGGSSGGNIYFSTNTLPVMTLNQYYSHQLQAYGGSAPYNYVVSSGSLPNGLSLSSSGLIYGTPTSASSVSFTVRATDIYGRNNTATFTINGGGVLGANTYTNGTLISEYGTVYITYKNMKTPFANASAFLGLGYSFNNVMSVGSSGLANSGYTVNSQYVQHPWGAWVKNGSTIYFVHQNGLIPVPAWDVFVNNGGSQIKIVNANTWDMQLPMQPVMTYGDYRLQ